MTTPDPTGRAVRVRFAPSPTGALHLGSAFVALANVMFARAHAGAQFVLRIDDTDRARSTDEHAHDVVRLLRWLGVEWDIGPVYQSQRSELYEGALAQLAGTQATYPCFCSEARLAQLRTEQVAAGLPPRYDGRCRALDPAQVVKNLEVGTPHVTRFALPERDVTIDDLVHGAVVVPAGAYGDPVLQRADGTAGYLLATVVDDAELGITHVIRGEDHLTNSARQVLLFEALIAAGFEGEVPSFAHLPLLRDESGAKLSKRAPLGTLDELVDEGYLAVTVRRYLAELLGCDPNDPFAAGGEPFRINMVGTGAPRVDRTRLDSIGRHDIAALPLELLFAEAGAAPGPAAEALVREVAAASPTIVRLRAEANVIFTGPGTGDLEVILADATGGDAAEQAALEIAFAAAVGWLRGIDDAPAGDDWAALAVREFRAVAKTQGLPLRTLLHPLRLAWTGFDSGPGLDLVLAAIGVTDALGRVQRARVVLEGIREGGGDRQLG